MAEKIIPQDFYVYLHRKASTGEVFYVGKGVKDRAWSKARSRYWMRVVAKHGYTVEIVQSGLQEWYAIELEADLIALYGKASDGLGLLVNLTDKAGGLSGHRHTKDSIQKMRIAKFGKPVSDDHKAKNIANLYKPEVVANRAIAVSASLKGKPLKDSQKQKMSLTRKGRAMSESHKDALKKARFASLDSWRVACGALPILCINTGIVFKTACCAAAWVAEKNPKAVPNPIRLVCKGKAKTAYGYTWRYA
jgi:hypothetical protein